MDYFKHYNRLIDRAKMRILEGYVEKHHVIPKCMGGTDEPANIAQLTAEEHYTAHLLLVKMYPENRSLLFAANMMCVDKTGNRINNKRYAWLKIRMYKQPNPRKGVKIGSPKTPRNPRSPETKPRKKRAKETKPRNRDYTMSEETKQKISISGLARNYKHSEETKEKIRQSNIRTKRGCKSTAHDLL